MKKTILIFLQLFLLNNIYSQVFDVQNIQYKGDQNKFINIVILGDGFTLNEQQNFIDKATILTNDLFSQEPWYNYKNYFNVYAIKVISNQSGVKHPNNLADCNTALVPVPFSNPDNYFGTSFDNSGIHRLVVPTNSQNITNVLANNFPNYDIVILVANSPYYGGSGGSRATVTLHVNSKEILIHELGHSAGTLADEYYAGDNYFGEKPNMTQQTNPNLIKWKNWLTTPQIGINSYGASGISNTWFKPTNNTCKMQVLGVPYCSVCKEKLIENIHVKANPIVSYSPVNTTTINSTNQFLDFNLTELMKPIPNTLNIKWQLDSNVFNTNLESFQVDQNLLSNGNHTLTATVVDEIAFVKTDNHSTIHLSTVTWTIQKNNLGISSNSLPNQISISVFPNPSIDKLNVEIDLENSSNLSMELVDLTGKILQTIPNKEVQEGKTTSTFDVSKLAAGTYIIGLKINGANYSKVFIKQ
jgi:IgA Peptidase M64/Secretion system C-terminal sorting domain